MIEILDILLFVVAVLLIAYVLYLIKERGVLMREIDVRAEKRFMKMKEIKEAVEKNRVKWETITIQNPPS